MYLSLCFWYPAMFYWNKVNIWQKLTEYHLCPLDNKEIKSVNPKGSQPWIHNGRTDAPRLWLPDVNSWLTGKDPDAGKDWRQKAERVAEDEMIGYNHRFNGHELGQIPGDREGQGGLECCSPWGCKKLDTIWRLNNKCARNFMPYTIHSTKAWWMKAFVRFTRKFGWETQTILLYIFPL